MGLYYKDAPTPMIIAPPVVNPCPQASCGHVRSDHRLHHAQYLRGSRYRKMGEAQGLH